MLIRPQELSAGWHVRIVRRRSAPNSPAALPEPRMGALGRLWSWGSGLEESRSAALLSAAGPSLQVTWWGIIGFIGGVCWLMAFAAVAEKSAPPGILLLPPLLTLPAGIAAGNLLFRSLSRRPILAVELDAMIAAVADPVEKEFLGLLRDLTQQTLPPEMERSLRESVVALGEAVESLPEPPGEPLDDATLMAEVTRLREVAATESDPVTAQSLQRRAQALLDQRQAQLQHGVRERRTRAIREEIRTQIGGLRRALSGASAADAGVGTLETAASAARQAALDAGAYVHARSELEESLSAPLPPSDSEDAQVVRLRPGQ